MLFAIFDWLLACTRLPVLPIELEVLWVEGPPIPLYRVMVLCVAPSLVTDELPKAAVILSLPVFFTY